MKIGSNFISSKFSFLRKQLPDSFNERDLESGPLNPNRDPPPLKKEPPPPKKMLSTLCILYMCFAACFILAVSYLFCLISAPNYVCQPLIMLPNNCN